MLKKVIAVLFAAVMLFSASPGMAATKKKAAVKKPAKTAVNKSAKTSIKKPLKPAVKKPAKPKTAAKYKALKKPAAVKPAKTVKPQKVKAQNPKPVTTTQNKTKVNRTDKTIDLNQKDAAQLLGMTDQQFQDLLAQLPPCLEQNALQSQASDQLNQSANATQDSDQQTQDAGQQAQTFDQDQPDQPQVTVSANLQTDSSAAQPTLLQAQDAQITHAGQLPDSSQTGVNPYVIGTAGTSCVALFALLKKMF